MRKPLSKNKQVVFKCAGRTLVGTIEDTYVRNRRRLYSVRAEHGTLYDNMPADSTLSPTYMVDTDLTEKYLGEPVE